MEQGCAEQGSKTPAGSVPSDPIAKAPWKTRKSEDGKQARILQRWTSREVLSVKRVSLVAVISGLICTAIVFILLRAHESKLMAAHGRKSKLYCVSV